ncbi:IS66 family transposase [Oribacterium sp. NK2B42]|uniref:IS66 family transposase n=1 Tax=Oribacterium sp. NK2B42 TaxID=689781 RepID=UPI0004929EE3
MKKSDLIGQLQMRLKAALAKIADFESGEIYKTMKEDHRKTNRAFQSTIDQKNARIQELTHINEKIWKWCQEVCEDQEKDHKAKIKELMRRIHQIYELYLGALKKNDELKDKNSELRQANYTLASELEDEREKNKKLIAQINRDYENSSKPSSQSVNHKKITNNREKTDRKPGGQLGHPGHRRRKQTPTSKIFLSASPEILNDPDYKETGKEVVKQLVNIRLVLEVIEYRTKVYRNSKTGEKYHAPFPKGVVDDVNYGGSIKAFLYLLNNDCNVSIDKSSRFLAELTNNQLNISKGMINKLGKEFAEKTEEERTETFKEMLLMPVMHTDCTNARYNGKSAYVFINVAPDGTALYFAREKKGHEGVKGTVTEYYNGILVHDHESTFYNYGSEHQECLAHILRYLKDGMEMEPEKTWHRSMRELLREMIHYRNEHESDMDSEVVADFETRYMKVLETARDEYEYVPPSKYYKDGYNLYLRMRKHSKEHLLFLHNVNVPSTNNIAERFLRGYKRKQGQVMSFRCFDTITHHCEGRSVLVKIRQNEGANVFDEVTQRFDS